MKVAVIGGAGVRTVIFINGLLKRYKKLNIDKVTLYDTNFDKLKIIGKLCEHVIARKKENLQLEVVFTAEEAIKGADYVVTTLRVGGDHSRVIDETIALEEGVIGQETTGFGGFSMAIRTIPILLDYCKMIKELAPNAWIFNFTNPSGLVSQALKNHGYDKVIGICDAPSSTKFRMADRLNIDEDNLYLEFFGLNHLSWIRSVKKEDREVLQELIADDNFLKSIQEFSMFDFELIRSMGFLPNEYLYYYYHREKALENILKSGATRGKSIEDTNIQMMKELNAMDIDADPEAALQVFLYYMEVRERSYMRIETGNDAREKIEKGNLEVPEGMGYAGVMLDCIEGLQSETGKYLVLSVENNGCIAGLNDDDVVEVTCKVSKKGAIPVKIGEVPEDCYLLIRIVKLYEKLTLKAIESKSKEMAIRALMVNPLVSSYSLAKRLIEKCEKAYGTIFTSLE